MVIQCHPLILVPQLFAREKFACSERGWASTQICNGMTVTAVKLLLDTLRFSRMDLLKEQCPQGMKLFSQPYNSH